MGSLSLNITHKDPLWLQAWVMGHPAITEEATRHLAQQVAFHRPHHEVSSVGLAPCLESFGVCAHTFVSRRAPLGRPGFNAYPQSAIDLESIRQDLMNTFPGVSVIMASQDRPSRHTSPRQNEVDVDISFWGPQGLKDFPVVTYLSRRAPGTPCQQMVSGINAVCAGAGWDAAGPLAQVFVKEITRLIDATTKTVFQDWLDAAHRHAHLEHVLPAMADAELVRRF